MNPKDNPNAVVGGGSALGGGALVVALLHLVGLEVDAYLAVAIAGVVSTIALAVGRTGIRGLIRSLWRGSGGER